jgi:hypothetical protein
MQQISFAATVGYVLFGILLSELKQGIPILTSLLIQTKISRQKLYAIMIEKFESARTKE